MHIISGVAVAMACGDLKDNLNAAGNLICIVRLSSSTRTKARLQPSRDMPTPEACLGDSRSKYCVEPRDKLNGTLNVVVPRHQVHPQPAAP